MNKDSQNKKEKLEQRLGHLIYEVAKKSGELRKMQEEANQISTALKTLEENVRRSKT